MTRTQRTYVIAAAVASIVTAANASQGAYFSQSWGWVALAFLVPTTVLLILDRVRVPGRLRIAFAGLTAALGVWIALSSLWSISTAASIREVERMLVYVAVAFAVALVLRRGDGPAVLSGVIVGATLVVSYGLATRLFQDRFGVADDPFNSYRLAEPLGYWNSFGLLAAMCAIGVLGSIAHARHARVAVCAAAVLPVVASAFYFTFSRGSWVALAVGFGACVAVDARRLRFVWSTLAVAPASVIAVVVSARQEALTTEDPVLSAATRQGHRVALLLLGLVALSAVLGWIAHVVAERAHVGARVRRLFDASLVAGVIVLGVAALTAAGGPSAAFDGLRNRFEAAPVAGRDLNDRLFNVSANGRIETIRVAWDAGSDRPLVGIGAGTFEYTWYERRPNLLVVRDAHSLYIETFDELGGVGLLLLAAVLIAPLFAGLRARRIRHVAPATGAFLAWVAAASLDWHWEMVGVTLTALLAASVALVSAERGSRTALAVIPRGALVATGVVLSVLAVWSLVGNQALFAAREAVGRKEWSDGRTHARRADALLFWSAEPSLVLGDVAAGLGDRDGALRAYRDAVETDPASWIAWLHLAQVARGTERADAYRRVRQLNPRQEGLPGA